MAAGSSSSNLREEYPYPSHVCAPNFVTVKLSGRDVYNVWRTQMLCLLKSHDMIGFVDGTLERPPAEMKSVFGWRRSDSLAAGWILGSLCQQTLKCVVNHLKPNADFTAKDVWDKLQKIYGPLFQQAAADLINTKDKEETEKESQEAEEKEAWKEMTEAEEKEAKKKRRKAAEYVVDIYSPKNADAEIDEIKELILIEETKKRKQVEEKEAKKERKEAEEKEAEKEREKTDAEIEEITEVNSISEDEGETEKERQEAEAKNEAEKKRKEEEVRTKLHQSLYRATQSQCYNMVYKLLKKEKVSVIEKIATNGNTALHLVVGTTKEKNPLKNLLALAPGDDTILEMVNSEGSTLLHVAAIVGNTEAAQILVEKNEKLLLTMDNEGKTPLARALSNMHTETYLYLFDAIRDKEKAIIFEGAGSDELLVNAISSKNYESACKIIEHYRKFPGEAVLMAIAQNFPRKVKVIDEEIIIDIGDEDGELACAVILAISVIASVSVLVFKKPVSPWMIYPRIVGAIFLSIIAICGIYMLLIKPMFWIYDQLLSSVDDEEVKRYDNATHLFKEVCKMIQSSGDSRYQEDCYKHWILEATRKNENELVLMIVDYFPNAIWSRNEDGHNIIQHAVINRSEKVYNLLYQMSEHRNIYKTITDPLENNLLHLAGRLAPPEKLNHISGAALQIQHELQWFREVQGFVCPLNIMQKNLFDETPQMVFTKEHKELVIDGEKWMKETAQSYTITAALITTIVFAAAITVPGGNNQENGVPVFTNKTTFKIFAVADAISLFTSVTSLLMFLSILTTRFAEEDFLYKLPRKLLIGLTTLFISTTAMIVAFGATLFLVFGETNTWILVPIAALTCLPITSFVTLQFPLIADLVTSTYGRSIFVKKSNDLFY